MNQNEKKAPQNRVEAFFAGKGFYIVLLLCVAVIGVSAWSMLSGGALDGGNEPSLAVSAPAEEDAVTTGKTAPVLVPERPAATAAPTPAPVPAPEPSPAAQEPQAEAENRETGTPAIPEEPVAVSAETVSDYFIWPVSGTVENGYSMTALVFDRTMQDWRTHDGLDVAAEIGTQVRAVANGKVENVYFDERLGTTVVIGHSGGLESIYANLAGTPTVTPGDAVSVGQIIGAVGDTALCEIGEVGHLHFAMTKDGLSVDPGEYLP